MAIRRYAIMLLYSILLLNAPQAAAETHVSGGIFADATWTVANSPYIVDSNIVVFPGCTLTIEPGVTVKFKDTTSLEVRGKLYAVGRQANHIVFTSFSSSPVAGSWYGVWGGEEIIQYCEFFYAQNALQGGSNTSINNCKFVQNINALSNGTAVSCIFENNSIAMNGNAAYNCTFTNNVYGCNAVNIYNCTFTGQTGNAVNGASSVENCTITGNNIGIEGLGRATNNSITGNAIGIILYGGVSGNSINFNNIYNNSLYNIKNASNSNIDLSNNWWGTTNPAEIEAKIYDAKDDISLGLVSYVPFLTHTATGADTTSRLKFKFYSNGFWSSPAVGNDGTIYFVAEKDLYAISPNGILKWKYSNSDFWDGYSMCIGSDGTIYHSSGLQSTASHLIAISPEGFLKWDCQIEGYAYSFMPAIGSDGTIYFNVTSSIYAVGPNGTLKWSSQLDDYYLSPVSIGGDGTVYIRGSQYLFAFDPSGLLKWKLIVLNYGISDVRPSIAISKDGIIYIIGVDNYKEYLAAVTPAGKQQWIYWTETYISDVLSLSHISSPTIDSAGTIYFGGRGHLYAVAPTGALKWTYPVEDYRHLYSPVIGSDGTIYFVTDSLGSEKNSRFYALGPDRTLKWSFQADNLSLPVIANDGTVYFTGNKNSISYLYAFESGTGAGLMDSPWPKWGHDLQNTGRYGAVIVNIIPGDVDSNGKVDIFDLLGLLKSMGKGSTDKSADVNSDGKLNIFDLLALLKILSEG
ncbi:MAG TPA: PQQ-binding-like beta-propeller repeat protein [archaeon]|nr:PQQ-binding-like beta-propeller repeat protein [archaeon]